MTLLTPPIIPLQKGEGTDGREKIFGPKGEDWEEQPVEFELKREYQTPQPRMSQSSLKPRLPKRLLYGLLLTIFSTSAVGLLADLETWYLLKAYILLLLLQGGFFLIYISFYRLPRRRSLSLSGPRKTEEY